MFFDLFHKNEKIENYVINIYNMVYRDIIENKVVNLGINKYLQY